MCLRRVSRILCSAVAVLAMSFSAQKIAQASSLTQEKTLLQELQQQSNQTYQQIAKEKVKETVLQNKLSEYKDSLQNVQQAILLNQQQMKDLQTELISLQKQIHQNDIKLNTFKSDLYARLRLMYENGNVQYLSVLLHATSFQDLLNRLHGLEVISQENHVLLQEVQTIEARLAAQNVQKSQKLHQLVHKHDELLTLQHTDAVLAADESTLLHQTQNQVQQEEQQRGLLESQIHLTQSQIQQIELQTEEANLLMQNKSYINTTISNMPTGNASAIISFAEQFLGVPYVWGGTSPSGFDCSGFTQYVLAHFGIQIERTSEEQFAEGIPVSENNLQPGDLVFFSTYAPGASHVGIYIGNGLMIDAQDMGVSIDSVFNSYWGPKYLGARQMFKS
ncbi:NlpC/P60 family protein [Alicyclobacillus tolerans]|uniref:NlpC/P60 family protein n=1 Tax=Alicyclobacillus tolerans TaxID=90970 RepID=A0A1M6K722_9BACL|nr:NlpC/P60 family protein [Alicyclobacillus montanus]